jgi:hypothetical protein
MTHIAAAATESSSSVPTIIVAIIVAIIALIGSVTAAIISARSTSKSVAKTLESDRRNRLRDKQLELYTDLLTYIQLRRGARAARTALVKVDAVDYDRMIQDFEDREFSDIDGRTNALASHEVLAAFNRAQQADRNVTRHRIVTGGQLGEAAVKAAEETHALVTEADRLDEELRKAIRQDVHDLPQP